MKRVIAVVFKPNGDTNYNYLWDGELLCPGDKVIVDTNIGFNVATVRIDDAPAGPSPTRWVIQRVDVKAHEERVAKEIKIKELKALLAAKVRKFKDEQVLTLLAQTDSEAASYIVELDKLEGK